MLPYNPNTATGPDVQPPGGAGPRVGGTQSGRRRATVTNLNSKQQPLVIPGTGLNDWLAYSKGMMSSYQGYMAALTGFSQTKSGALAQRAEAIARARQAGVQGVTGVQNNMLERGTVGSSMQALGQLGAVQQMNADITGARTQAASTIAQGRTSLMGAQADYQTTMMQLQQGLAASKLGTLASQFQSGYLPGTQGPNINPFAGQGVGGPGTTPGAPGVQQVRGTSYAPRMQ